MSRNYVKLCGMFRRFKGAMYVDTPEHVADDYLVNMGFPIKFGTDMAKEGCPYVICFAYFKKEHLSDFELAMKRMVREMEVLGHDDYGEQCAELFRELGVEAE